MRTFRRRRGASLLIVLTLCFMAALAITGTYLHFQWAQASTITARQRFLTRMELASLAAKGRRHLRRSPNAGRPAAFMDLQLFGDTGEGGATLEVYDLSYDIPAGGWKEEFFPPKPGAYLIRASKSGMTLETVLLASGDQVLEKPVMWRERY